MLLGLLGLAALGWAHPLPDLVNLVQAPLALAALVWAAALVWRRAHVKAALPVAAALLLAGALALPRAAAPACAPGDSPLLTLLWANIGDAPRPAALARWLAAERADVIGLGEVSGTAGVKLRAALAPHYPHLASCAQNGRCSTLLAVRQAPLAVKPLARGDAANRKALSAVGMRLADGAGGSVPVYAAHLSWPLPDGRQRSELAELSGALPADPRLIVMGDFNASPRMHTLRRFAAAHRLAPVDAGRPTWPLRWGAQPLWPLWQIDQMLIGPGWRVAEVRALEGQGSDHRALKVTLCATG